MNESAQRLLAYETNAGKAVAREGATAFRICEKWRMSQTRPMGVAGYRALFSHALAVASADVPWLRGLHIQAGGTLEGFAELKTKLSGGQITEGEVALVAVLLGLLGTLIGPTLTMQLIRQVWPKAAFSGCEL